MNAQIKKPQSGTEMMLRSLGMGEIMDAAKSLADNGTLTKILTFADHAESIVAQIAELNANVTAMRAELRDIKWIVTHSSSFHDGPDGVTDGPVLDTQPNGDARPEPSGHDGATLGGADICNEHPVVSAGDS